MTDPTGNSNVVRLDLRRRARTQDIVASLEAELARERQMLATLMANAADVGDLERCIEMSEALLAIARA